MTAFLHKLLDIIRRGVHPKDARRVGVEPRVTVHVRSEERRWQGAPMRWEEGRVLKPALQLVLQSPRERALAGAFGASADAEPWKASMADVGSLVPPSPAQRPRPWRPRGLH